MNSDVPVKSPPIRDFIVLAVIAVVLVVLRLSFLHVPFERDEGFYATIGQVILDGGLPYRDAIDMKPPGVFYIYALAIAVFGKTVESVRVFTTVYSLATLGVVYWLARRVAGGPAALMAAALFALYSGAPLMQGSSSNSEVFLVLPLMLSAAFFVAAATTTDKRGVLIAGSGVFMGLALLIKTVVLPYIVLTAICCLFLGERPSVKERVVNACLFLAPMVALVAATVIYFFARGGLKEFIAFNVTIPFMYSKGGNVGGLSPVMVTKLFLSEYLLPVLLAVPACVWLLRSRRSLPGIFVALLLPVACLGVIMPGKYFPHYYIQLVPVLCILGGIGLAEVVERRKLALALSVPMLAAVVYSAWFDREFYMLPPDQVSVNKYGTSIFVESKAIAQYIKSRTAPGDYIFQWGFEPEIYFLADRRSPVPHISSTSPSSLPNSDEAISQMMATLREKKPRYIVMQREWSQYPGLDPVSDLLRSSYLVETQIGYGVIFRRR